MSLMDMRNSSFRVFSFRDFRYDGRLFILGLAGPYGATFNFIMNVHCNGNFFVLLRITNFLNYTVVNDAEGYRYIDSMNAFTVGGARVGLMRDLGYVFTRSYFTMLRAGVLPLYIRLTAFVTVVRARIWPPGFQWGIGDQGFKSTASVSPLKMTVGEKRAWGLLLFKDEPSRTVGGDQAATGQEVFGQGSFDRTTTQPFNTAFRALPCNGNPLLNTGDPCSRYDTPSYFVGLVFA